MRTMMRRGAVLLAVLSAVALVASPVSAAEEGGGKRVRRAVTATQEQGTARFFLEMTIRADGERVEVFGEGVMALDGSRGNVDLEFAAAGESFSMEERIIDDVVYIDMGDFLDQAPSVPPALEGRPWVRLSFEDVGIDPETLRQLDPTSGSDPSSQLGALQGITGVQRVGSERIDGVATTRYRGTVDLARALEAVPDPEDRAELEASLEQAYGDSPPKVNVWLDGRDRVRKMKMRFAIDVPGAGRAEATMVMAMGDFGVEFEVEAPPATETIDFATFQDAIGNAA